MGLSDACDSHVCLIDGGSDLCLVDAGGGDGVEAILVHVRADGLDPSPISQVLITHCHADHACGSAGMKAALGCEIVASASGARHICW